LINHISRGVRTPAASLAEPVMRIRVVRELWARILC
jgi:hypothetical protein